LRVFHRRSDDFGLRKTYVIWSIDHLNTIKLLALISHYGFWRAYSTDTANDAKQYTTEGDTDRVESLSVTEPTSQDIDKLEKLSQRVLRSKVVLVIG